MKIMIYDNSGHPFQVQLSRSLAKRGYEVLHLYSKSFQTPKGNLSKGFNDPVTFETKGLLLSQPFNKYSFFKRLLQENEFGRLVSMEIERFEPDVIIASNVPLETLKYVVKACNKVNSEFIFWVQDFYGIAIKKILGSKFSYIGHMIGNYYIFLERKFLTLSDHVILITEDFREVMTQWGIEKSKTIVIPNWAPIEEMPVEYKHNAWSIQHKLHDKFCFFYTGTLGLKHNPELLLEIAFQFRTDENIRIVVVSEGLGADWLKKKKEELHLDNLVILNFQPFELLPCVMGTADVLISILENDAGVYSVPSKVLSYFCAKRALLLAVPSENLAAQIVSNHNMGLVVSPNDKSEFFKAAERLYGDEKLRNSMACEAREYAERYFKIDEITDKFVHLINN